jgi:hypothetical protein
MGLFEHHLTVDGQTDLRKWEQTCAMIDAKPLVIELGPDGKTGKHPRQMMWAVVTETDDPEGWVTDLWTHAVERGHRFVRSKLETPLDKSANFDPAYYEAHVKSLIPAAEAAEMVKACQDHGFVASRNALYPSTLGLEKWYFTLRSYDSGRDFVSAGADFARDFAWLTKLNWHTVRMEMEAVIFDTNPDLDRGWA